MNINTEEFFYKYRRLFLFIYIFLHFNVVKTKDTCADFSLKSKPGNTAKWHFEIMPLQSGLGLWEACETLDNSLVESVIYLFFLLWHGLEISQQVTRTGCITVKVANRTFGVKLPELPHILTKREISKAWKIWVSSSSLESLNSSPLELQWGEELFYLTFSWGWKEKKLTNNNRRKTNKQTKKNKKIKQVHGHVRWCFNCW